MDGAGSSSSGDVSSTTSATDDGPRADPDLPAQPNASPPPSFYVIVVTRNLAQIAPSRVRESRDGGAGAEHDAYGGLGFGFGAVPASGMAIACLPETTVGVGVGEAMESGECAVCLEEYEAGDVLRTMPCAHGFHERCIFGWLGVSRLCPLCRFALPPEDGTEADVQEEEDVR